MLILPQPSYARRMFFVLGIALWLSSVFLLGCSSQGLSDLSIPLGNGIAVRQTNLYPQVGALRSPEGSLCTTTLIGQHALLTAAHCVRSPGVYLAQFAFGQIESQKIRALGSGLVSDPNDIALVFVDVLPPFAPKPFAVGGALGAGDSVTLVGFGCDNFQTQAGAGIKRVGQNEVQALLPFIELVSPLMTSTLSQSPMGQSNLVGYSNATGLCFGDSGSPLLKNMQGQLVIVGVGHAGGYYSGASLLSEYVNMTSEASANWSFIQSANRQYNLGIIEWPSAS